MTLKHLDLFSGIGGFALAAEWAGMETVGFSEIDPYASTLLRQHWPHVRNYGDIRNVRNLRADIITGGFPCQPWSTEGRQSGNRDDRHLWPEMLRVIRDVRPAWVLGENVVGLVALGLDQVCADLEASGYEVQPLDIPACAIGALHKRSRIWILAHAKDGIRWPDAACDAGGESTGRGEAQSGHVWEGMRKPLHDRSEALAELERWDEWAGPTSALCGSGDGIPSRVDRNKALGNAIVPAVAYEILKTIAYQHAHAERANQQI